MTSPTPYQLLPRLSDEEYEALKNDIAENGVRVPIDVDEDGVILDGHHRAWITADLGVECPRRTVAGLTEEQKRTHAVAVNVHRRSLTREQRRALIQRSVKADPQLSDREHAARTGVSHPTVATVRRDLEAAGEVESFTTRVGRDGVPQLAIRPHAEPEPPSDDDLLDGDDWVQPAGPGFEATVTPPPKPKRRPLPEAFTEAGRDLSRAAERLDRLTQDDRFPKNRDTTHHQLPELLGALDNTTRLIQAMRLDQAQTTEEARRWWATSLHNISDALTDVANSIEQEQQ